MKLNREKFGPCIAEVGARAGVGDDEAFNIIQAVAAHGQKLRDAGEQNPFDLAATKISMQEVEAASLKRADTLRTVMKVNGATDAIREAGGVNSAITMLRSRTVGTSKGNRESTQGLARWLEKEWKPLLDGKLRAAGLDKVAVSGELDRQASEAMFAMSNKEPVPEHVTEQAKTMATLLRDAIATPRERLNDAGANIADGMNYVAHQGRSWDKMRAADGPNATPEAAFDAWWKNEQPRWGEQSFEGVTPAEGQSLEEARAEYARHIFYAYGSGIHKSPSAAFEAGGPAPPSYFGPANIAKRISEGRAVFYKDGGAFHDSMQQYGTTPNLTMNVMNMLGSSARHLGLLDRFGTNPVATVKLIEQKVVDEYQRSDPEGVRKFQGQMPSIYAELAHLDGSANRVENGREVWAKLGSTVRSWISMASLGSVEFTHLTSAVPTIASELAHHNVGGAETIGAMTNAVLGGLKGKEFHDTAADLGALIDGISHDSFEKYNVDDNLPGWASTTANIYMKYTGLPYTLNNFKAGVHFMLSHNLARRADQALSDVEPHLQDMLRKYGIQDGDWNLLRQGEFRAVNGKDYMTPGTAMKLDAGDAEALLRSRGELSEDADPGVVERAVQRYQWGLSDKLGTYFSDAADHSVVTPGAQERAFAYGQDRPGTAMGEFRRFFWQFKMWPLAQIFQSLGREVYMATSKGDAAWNIGKIFALTTLAGLGRMALNDAVEGKQQRNPMQPDTLAQGLAAGGGLGLFGDMLFGEMGRTGGLANMGGPLIGDTGKFYDIWNRFTKDASSEDPNEQANSIKHAFPPLVHLFKGLVPGANLFYLKGALDYLLWYHLYEAASPGWWDRTNQRMQREQGRTMLGYRPGAPVPEPWDLPAAMTAQ